MSVLWKHTLKNTALSVGLFAVLFGLLWLAELLIPGLTLLKWNDPEWCLGIPASIIGVGYVLSIRDPENYTGFYAGILMSLLLAIQFCLQSNYDLTVLYICIFVPFQLKSVIQWKKSKGADEFSPSFLNMRGMLLSLLCFVVMIIADWLLVTYAINHDSLTDGIVLKLTGALMIASSVLSNFWLIYRKNDAWIYWVIYSIAGVAFYIEWGNAFSIVLFSFFLVINAMAGIAWIRNTPPANYGWLRG